ncbi:hypothetical protein NFC73_20615 [Pseudarthrobacter sp. RMG13]|uniref:Uncharacterized protein n=1 Tax=Pseudarthrobacter humi TaxID=2952523 RepID=A0ABT1LUJ1_9MICC|nr:hypothetical protein [Pseudarthrobacter humi]MCP9002107.1 hypothetical protein [Pseudarthrobacter humi]
MPWIPWIFQEIGVSFFVSQAAPAARTRSWPLVILEQALITPAADVVIDAYANGCAGAANERGG